MMVIPDIPSSMAHMWLLKITEKTAQVDHAVPAIPSCMAQMWLLKITEKTAQVDHVIPAISSSLAQMWLPKLEKTGQLDNGNSTYSIHHGADVTAKNYRETGQEIDDGNSR